LQCGTNRLKHFLIARKSQQAFTRDDSIANADCKLAFLTAGNLYFPAQFILE
jgi:hypothetical protein